MKCNNAEKLLLLQDSGELTNQQLGKLLTHIHNCEDCRSFQQAIVEIQENVQTRELPSETILNNIKREARKLAPQNKSFKIIYWKPAFALAASAMIGLGLFFSTYYPNRIGLELVMTETELFDIQDQIVSIMYSGLSEDDLAFNFLMTYEEET